jgi:hypothetical protein
LHPSLSFGPEGFNPRFKFLLFLGETKGLVQNKVTNPFCCFEVTHCVSNLVAELQGWYSNVLKFHPFVEFVEKKVYDKEVKIL